jgi:hypothetical protein
VRLADIPLVCDMTFREWCAEELIDPRLEEILKEAFIAGFRARDRLRTAEGGPVQTS